ncbi:hypothetical protein OROHE_000625 [Orobanche hederae]
MPEEVNVLVFGHLGFVKYSIIGKVLELGGHLSEKQIESYKNKSKDESQIEEKPNWYLHYVKAAKKSPYLHLQVINQVLYVWFDAPIRYISTTSCYTPEWEKWWKNPEDVELFQFMGKDDVSFHTVLFPSTLLGTCENWNLVNSISATEFLNFESGKFSKSKGIGVSGNDVKDTKIPVEVWRYYLLSNRPENLESKGYGSVIPDAPDAESHPMTKGLSVIVGQRVDLYIEAMEKKWFDGCFLSTSKGYGSVIPDAPDAESHPMTKELSVIVGQRVDLYIEAMEKVKLKQGLKTAMSLSTEGNAYLQEMPILEALKTRPTFLFNCYENYSGACSYSCMFVGTVYSFFVFKQLNIPRTHISLSNEKGDVASIRRPWEMVPARHIIGDPKPLFEELKSERVVELREKYSGESS